MWGSQTQSEARDILAAHGDELLEGPPRGIRGLQDMETEAEALVNDLDEYPHAFVLGCVMDRQIKAERAWEIPWIIGDRIGSFEFTGFLALSRNRVAELFSDPNKLHRFPTVMAENFYLAIRKIADEYEGDASNIWSEGIGSARLVRRFLEFQGVGQKIATMAANILVRDFHIPLDDRRYIDVSADVHIRRVFSRLGFVRREPSTAEVIYAAREMNPSYPGVFDLPCWEIGRTWCTASTPDCPRCYMVNLCPTGIDQS